MVAIVDEALALVVVGGTMVGVGHTVVYEGNTGTVTVDNPETKDVKIYVGSSFDEQQLTLL